MNFGCGQLDYQFGLWTEEPLSEMLQRPADETEFKTAAGFKFELITVDRALVGSQILTVAIESDTVINEPHFTVEVEIVVWDCLVRSLDFFEQKLDDVQLNPADELVLPFTQYEQVPACGFDTEYSVVLIEKMNADVADLPFGATDAEAEGLVSVDLAS